MLKDMKTTRRSGFRRALLAGSAALVIGSSAFGLGAYSLLKPTATASGPIAAVPLTQMTSNDAPSDTASLSAGEVASQTLYTIESGASAATFTIDEVLRGSPK